MRKRCRFFVDGVILLLIPPPPNFPNRLVDDGKMIEAGTEMGEKGGQDNREPDLSDGVVCPPKYGECRECVSAAIFLVDGLIPLLFPPPLDVTNRQVDGGKMIEADTEMRKKGGQDDGEPDLSDGVVCPQKYEERRECVSAADFSVDGLIPLLIPPRANPLTNPITNPSSSILSVNSHHCATFDGFALHYCGLQRL